MKMLKSRFEIFLLDWLIDCVHDLSFEFLLKCFSLISSELNDRFDVFACSFELDDDEEDDDGIQDV